MAEISNEMKFWLFGIGAKWAARLAMVTAWLGLPCLIVGIIASAINKTIGLGAINWILIVIAIWIFALFCWLSAYVAAKEG
jgi:predicted permease